MKCPACQTANPDAAAFCNACGATLHAGASMTSTGRAATATAPARQADPSALETAAGLMRPQPLTDANATADVPRAAMKPAAVGPPVNPNMTLDAPVEGAVVDPGATLDAPLPQRP